MNKRAIAGTPPLEQIVNEPDVLAKHLKDDGVFPNSGLWLRGIMNPAPSDPSAARRRHKPDQLSAERPGPFPSFELLLKAWNHFEERLATNMITEPLPPGEGRLPVIDLAFEPGPAS